MYRSEWLSVNVRLIQDSAMCPLLLFRVYMDGVVREKNARVLGKGRRSTNFSLQMMWH